MKKIIIIILVFLSVKSTAQVDSTTLPITVTIPVKAVILYGYYLSQSFAWADRKAPDQINALVGSGTLPDSLTTVTLAAGKLSTFAINLLSDRYGALSTVNASIFSNSPSIPGYTALFSQVNTIANGAGSQKAAGTYVKNQYNNYVATMAALYTQMQAAGLSWIKN